jgi:hypothetical protein
MKRRTVLQSLLALFGLGAAKAAAHTAADVPTYLALQGADILKKRHAACADTETAYLMKCVFSAITTKD